MKAARILTPLALAVSAAVFSATASAGDSGYPMAAPPPAPTGGIIVRIGASHVDPDEDSTELNFAGVILPDFVGTEYELDSDTTWNFSVAFLPIEHFGIEFVYIGESEHDVDVEPFGYYAGSNHLALGDLERRTGAAFVNWYPMDATCLVQPYIGFGGHYTDFDENDLSLAANDYLAFEADAVGPGELRVRDAGGWAGQIGVDIKFGHDSSWLVNAAVQYLNLDTSTRVRFPVDGAVAEWRAGLDVDPWVYNLGIGYRF